MRAATPRMDGTTATGSTGRALTVLQSMPHFAMHASPPVPGAMASGYFSRSVDVGSGMPVAVLSTLSGICIRDAHMVWMPLI